MIKISTIRDNCFPAAYVKGRQLCEMEKYRNYSEELDEFKDLVIFAEVKGSGNGWYDTTVTIDSGDEIIDYHCDCPAYESYWGMCKHCVAVVLAYRNKHKASLDRPEIRKGLSVRKEEPAPKETSFELKNVIARYAMRKNACYLGEYYHQIKLEPVISFDNRNFSIEFRIGLNKMYVLKNICKLLSDVEKGNYSAYGKNLGFTHDRSAFTAEALEWIDLISDYMRTKFSLNFADQIYSSNFRNIALSSYGIDKVFQKYLDQTITINSKPYQVTEADPHVQVTITRQKDAGADIEISVDAVYIRGVDRDYFMDSNTIYMCTREFSRDMMPVYTPLICERSLFFYRRAAESEKIFLSKEDYTAFCGNVLPVLHQYTELEIKDIDFDEFMPQEAELNVYLSQDEKDASVVLVKAEALYGTNTYNIFQQVDTGSQYRDLEKESALESCLKKYFEYNKDAGDIYGRCMSEDKLFGLIEEGMGAIREMANLFVDEKLRGMRIVKSPAVNIGVGLSGDLLDLEISTEGIDHQEMEQILASYKRRKKYYRMKNGDFVNLEDDGLALVSELAEGLGISGSAFRQGHITAPKYRASYIAETMKDRTDKVNAHRSSRFKQLVRDMNSYEDNDFEVPKELNAELRSYQKDGFRWLAMLSYWGFGGILADDMGLGKTLQMIALLELKKESALIVCPASLIYNWESEIKRFAPDLKITVAAGNSEQREKAIKGAGSDEILVTSYDLLKRDIAHYKEKSFSYMVIDEAQYIKNAGTQASKAVKQVQAVHRFALTGTPIENRLSDLWSIFDFIMPGYLYAYKQFKEELEVPVVQEDDQVSVTRLRRMVNPFILRRKKGDVLKDLPDKLEKVIYVKMDAEQRRLYEAKVKQIQLQLEGQTEDEYRSDKLKYLAELTNLRQICCSPSLCYENYGGQSAKTEACMELLTDMVQGGHRILLFSQFTTMLNVLAEKLKKNNISFLYLSGKNSKEQRREMVKEFQEGNVQVFLISLKAGGTGLNLTKADVVIHYDPWWNVAAQNQATDRTHRIGQKNVVTVMKLVVKDTIEEKILELQEKKARLAENVMEGQGVSDHRISREELMELIQ